MAKEKDEALTAIPSRKVKFISGEGREARSQNGIESSKETCQTTRDALR
jgi:hypothetical protein